MYLVKINVLIEHCWNLIQHLLDVISSKIHYTLFRSMYKNVIRLKASTFELEKKWQSRKNCALCLWCIPRRKGERDKRGNAKTSLPQSIMGYFLSSPIDTITDFFINLGIKPCKHQLEIPKQFFIRPTKIMNIAKFWLSKSFFSIKNQPNLSLFLIFKRHFIV